MAIPQKRTLPFRVLSYLMPIRWNEDQFQAPLDMQLQIPSFLDANASISGATLSSACFDPLTLHHSTDSCPTFDIRYILISRVITLRWPHHPPSASGR